MSPKCEVISAKSVEYTVSQKKSEVISPKCEVRSVHCSIPGFPKHETVHATDFALMTDDFGLIQRSLSQTRAKTDNPHQQSAEQHCPADMFSGGK